ncbi:MAG: 50S ribosomal protein L9 [Acidimicrobiia bacterium]
MRLVLRSDVNGVGKKGDIVEVADGFGRNLLLPRGLAFKASEGAVAQASAMRRARDLKDASDRAAAEEVARALVAKTITVKARAGAGGRLFGSVTPAEIVGAVAAQTGIDIDRRKVLLPDHIKALGAHAVPVKLHSDVEFTVNIDVVAG